VVKWPVGRHAAQQLAARLLMTRAREQPTGAAMGREPPVEYAAAKQSGKNGNNAIRASHILPAEPGRAFPGSRFRIGCRHSFGFAPCACVQQRARLRAPFLVVRIISGYALERWVFAASLARARALGVLA
jgi:hypothetical protein